MDARANYIVSDAPKLWRTRIPLFGQVRYSDLYSGIDVIFYSSDSKLEYDVVVSPGTNPSDFGLEAGPGTKLRLNGLGDLVHTSSESTVRWKAPTIYQLRNDKVSYVRGGYSMVHPDTVQFEVRRYDHSLPLIVDPTLSFASFIGGDSSDDATRVVAGSDGSIYISGTTASTMFTSSSQRLGPAPANDVNIFIAKLSPARSELEYLTIIGGSNNESASGLQVDSSGSAVVTGSTYSDDFPLEKPIQMASSNDNCPSSESECAVDAIVFRLSPEGDSLLYSTYLGGAQFDQASDLALDYKGRLYVVGFTKSPDFPVVHPLQARIAGAADFFVTRFSVDGSRILYSTYFGGKDNEAWPAVAVADNGSAYIGGVSRSRDFPTKRRIANRKAEQDDGVVARLSRSGGRLIFSTFLGGSDNDSVTDITVDARGNLLAVGLTQSPDNTILKAAQGAFAGGFSDAFVTKVGPKGTLMYSTFLGGDAQDIAWSISATPSGSVYVSGETGSKDFPTREPIQADLATSNCPLEEIHCIDAFVARLSRHGQLAFSTFLGGSRYDSAAGIYADGQNAFVAGITWSPDFPLVDPQQPLLLGTTDAFVSVILK